MDTHELKYRTPINTGVSIPDLTHSSMIVIEMYNFSMLDDGAIYIKALVRLNTHYNLLYVVNCDSL